MDPRVKHEGDGVWGGGLSCRGTRVTFKKNHSQVFFLSSASPPCRTAFSQVRVVFHFTNKKTLTRRDFLLVGVITRKFHLLVIDGSNASIAQ